MEELFPVVIIIISAIASIISSANKTKKQQDAKARHKAASAARMQAAEQLRQPTQRPTEAAPQLFGEGFGPDFILTVHPHVEPDCDTHDAPGSLGVTSMEGKDPCHVEQLTHKRTEDEPAEVEQGGLTFDWSGENLVKAFVMQEVLTRPCDRRTK